jgi:hypothetical protein
MAFVLDTFRPPSRSCGRSETRENGCRRRGRKYKVPKHVERGGRAWSWWTWSECANVPRRWRPGGLTLTRSGAGGRPNPGGGGHICEDRELSTPREPIYDKATAKSHARNSLEALGAFWAKPGMGALGRSRNRSPGRLPLACRQKNVDCLRGPTSGTFSNGIDSPPISGTVSRIKTRGTRGWVSWGERVKKNKNLKEILSGVGFFFLLVMLQC